MYGYDNGFHLLAFTKTVGAASNFEDVPAVTDGWATLTNGHYILQKDMQLAAAYAQGLTITEARINTPSLRAISLPSLVPVNAAAAPGSLSPYVDFGDYDPLISAIDEIALETSNTGAGERHIAGIWMKMPSSRIATIGPVFTVRATAAITAGNLVWGEGAFTLQQTLPAGRYQVVGMDVVGANLIFARLRFPEQGPLPGVLARASFAVTPWNAWRMGRFGLFGEFQSTAPPLLQLFGSAAPTTQTLYLDLVKVK